MHEGHRTVRGCRWPRFGCEPRGFHAGQDDDPRVVEAAAKLGVRWIERDGTFDIDFALAAFDKKLSREGRIAGTSFHSDYRSELLKVMLAADACDDMALEPLRTDSDPKVRAIAEEEFVRRRA